MGSGSVSAYGELEIGYRSDLTLEEAKQLAIKGITAGIMHDLGSGSNVDLVILQRGKTTYLRNHVMVGKREIEKPTPYVFKRNNIGEINRSHFD